jgi:glycyl-tRNA synthetase beta chain
MQAGAARDLERMARDHLAAAGFLPEALKTFAGPRRRRPWKASCARPA